MIVDCCHKITKEVRADHNASLVEDLLTKVKFVQESRLTITSPLTKTKYEKEDFQHGIKAFLDKFLSAESGTKTLNKGTQTPSGQVLFHIKGVGIVLANVMTRQCNVCHKPINIFFEY